MTSPASTAAEKSFEMNSGATLDEELEGEDGDGDSEQSDVRTRMVPSAR